MNGWQVFFDGELVFSADRDQWQAIGPAIAKIMDDRQPVAGTCCVCGRSGVSVRVMASRD